MREVKIHAYYRHFKGDVIFVEDIAYHTETEEPMVVYHHNGKLWVRPMEMFLSKVNKEKYPDATQEYRFEQI